MTRNRSTARRGGVLLFAAVATLATLLPATTSAAAPAQVNERFGMIFGWRDEAVVEMFFSLPYFCRQPPASQAESLCEAGLPARVLPPTGDEIIDTLMLIPSGFTPARRTLSCPTAGRCIGQPRTIDLSRVLGDGYEQAVTPPHSFIFAEGGDDRSIWHKVIVVFVTDLETWNDIAGDRDINRVRELQEEGAGLTEDIPSNLYLYWFSPEAEEG